jgi:hypothetical protein
MASPLERSKAKLEEEGYHVWKVERPASMYQPTLDLFNCMDLVAIRSDRLGVLGIQCCAEDIMPHVHKILEGYIVEKLKKKDGISEIIKTVIPPNPYIKIWLEAKNLFFIWGWRLRKHEGTKATYQLREVELVLKDGIVVAEENSHVPEPTEG